MGFWQRLMSGGSGFASGRVALEAVLVVLLATQAARLVWIIAVPAPPAPAAHAEQADLTILASFNPFLGADTPTGGQASGQAMRLYGVRADPDGRGSAIIGTADGKQASYLVGETVAPGIVLQAVHGNHVVLARGAATTRLTFPEVAQ